MATCKDCIHEKLCVIKAFPDAFENTQWDKEPCDHFLSTADVVPKSEVERVYYNLQAVLEERAETKREIAREIFGEIETVLCRSVYPRVNANGTITSIRSMDWHIRCDDYNAIKKKYTEGQSDG